VTGFRAVRDEASAVFYDAAAAGTLLIRRCPTCGTRYPPQQRRCHDSETLEWVEASGVAAVVSWAVDHVPPPDPVFAAVDGTSLIFGWVELDEGPWMQVAIVDADPATLHEGTSLRVRFVRPGGGEAIPIFGPA
jgi:uncharacterized OB-fold protein